MPYAKELDEILGEVAEADGEDVTIEQLKERIADLESAILVAHKTGDVGTNRRCLCSWWSSLSQTPAGVKDD